MRKNLLNAAAVLVIGAAWCQTAAAFDFNFKVASWNTSHTPAGDVTTAIFPATGVSVYRAQLIFHRGTVPATRVVYDATNRLVTLHYALAEFPVVSNLLEQSTSTFVNYTDVSGTPYAYLYTNHSP